MSYSTDPSFRIPISTPFDLGLTLRSGQAFRWRVYGGAALQYRRRAMTCRTGEPTPHASKSADNPETSYCGVIGQHAVVVAQRGDFLEVHLDEAVSHDAGQVATRVSQYFAFDEDQAAIERELASTHPVLGEMIRRKPGLRILRQEPWECLSSFILSAHNNIPAIERTVEALCDALGRQSGFRRNTYPSPEAVLRGGEQTLRNARCGFRAKYLAAAAEKILSGEVLLSDLESLSTPVARSELMRLPGVGRKVADCVLLFAYHRLETFPVDVWVKRAMARLYPETERMDAKRVAEEGERRFGRYAGYAQEYLYWFERAGVLENITG